MYEYIGTAKRRQVQILESLNLVCLIHFYLLKCRLVRSVQLRCPERAFEYAP